MADAAFDAEVLINDMELLAFTSDRGNRAVARAHSTAGACPFHNLILDERPADLRWAAFFFDVGFVFIQEMVQG